MELFVQILVYGIIIIGFIFEIWLGILNYNNRKAPIPEEVKDVYEPKEYSKWLDYNMATYKFGKTVYTIDTVVFLIFLLFGLFNLFDDWSRLIFSNYRLQILLFFGFYFIITFIIKIFTSYHRTFKIEEKFGFNKSTKKTFIVDKIKNFVLTIVFGGGLIYLMLVIDKYAGDLFFLYAWIAIMVIVLIINVIYVPFIVPMFNKVTPLEDGELKDKIEKFATEVGYEVSKISVMDASKRSTKLNAFFTGFGRFKHIILFDTLLDKMTDDQIVSVLAHEIGHNKHKHILFNLVQSAITMLIYIGVLGIVLQTDVLSTAFGFDGVHFGFSLILFTVLLEPISIILGLLTSYYSRKHEYQADAFAARYHDKNHMEDALKVLTKENFSNLTPHPLYVKLTYSHPPTADRIRAIRKVESNG